MKTETQNKAEQDYIDDGYDRKKDDEATETEFNLSEKIKIYPKSIKGYAFEFGDVKEFIRLLKEELSGDTLAYGYKDYEKSRENMSSMEICNDNEDCNSFVIKKIKEIIDKLAGDKLIK